MYLRNSRSPMKKFTTRHYKRISESISYQRPLEDDVIAQLYKYRRQKTKQTFPNKDSSFSQTEKPVNSHNRPTSAQLNNSIFSALKTQELSPLKLTNSQVFLEQSVDRLYKGSRPTTQSVDMQNTPLFQLAEVVCEKKAEEIEIKLKSQDEALSGNLINDLIFLKPLKFDLELNWEIARGKETLAPEKKLGIFYVLQEKMINPLPVGSLNTFNLDPIVDELKEFSRLFREILRGIAYKSGEDEAVLMEMLWKVVMKLIDTSLGKHEFALNCVIESTKSRLKYMHDDFNQKLKIKVNEFEKKFADLNKENETLKHHVKTLTKEKGDLIQALNDKTKTLVELTEVESQEKACVEFRGLLNKLSSYITETESEQSKQVNTLNHISVMIQAADMVSQNPETKYAQTQTLWQISESYLPESEKQVFSKYPLFPILIKNEKVQPKTNALVLCQNTIENCDGQLSFYVELMIYLQTFYKDKQSLILNYRGIYQHLLNDTSNSGKFYLLLLSNSKPEFLKIEQIIFKLYSLFTKNSESNSMNMSKLLDFLQNYLPEEREFCEEILEIITKTIGEKDRYFLIAHRYFLAMEKMGRGPKGIADHENISSNEFSEWAKHKLNWWVSAKDLSDFTKNHQNKAFSSLAGHENSVSEKVKEFKIEKDTFLLAALSFSYTKFKKNEAANKAIETIDDYPAFKEIINRSAKEMPDKKLQHGFAELVLGTSYEDILEKILNFEFIDLKICEAPKLKKKPLKALKKPKK